MRRRLWMVAAAIGLAACVDGGGTSGPNFAISDATHGSLDTRNRFFYWLPPMVPNPNPTGTANQFASPEITVCQLNDAGTACAENAGQRIVVAQFSKTAGTGGQVIRVNSNRHYQVNWRTDLSDLNPDKVYRIILEVDGQVYGFADVEVGRTGGELKNVDQNLFVPLVDGRTLPINFRIEAGAACAGREAECAEAIVSPSVQTVVTVVDGNVPLAFGDFPTGWTTGEQLVRIERIFDGGFDVGDGPLATDFPQYPLFFHYFTTAAQPFTKRVRIGVCNVDDPEENPYHPHHRETTVLAMGGTPETFRTLPRAPTIDILGNCQGAERETPPIGWLPARLNELAAALSPKMLHANAVVVVDGGAGGSTDAFSPAGTVDTASGDLGAPVLLSPLSEPLIIQNNPEIGCTLSAEPTRGYGFRIVFDWSDVSGATAYEIFAEHEGAALPIVNTTVEGSTYTLTSCNSFVPDGNLTAWHWRVRALGSGETAGPWSEFVNFAFEPCRLPDETECRAP